MGLIYSYFENEYFLGHLRAITYSYRPSSSFISFTSTLFSMLILNTIDEYPAVMYRKDGRVFIKGNTILEISYSLR